MNLEKQRDEKSQGLIPGVVEGVYGITPSFGDMRL